jgi:hypothetical protein
LIGAGGSGGLSTSSKDHNIFLSSSTSPGLAPLATYGGPTKTMALLPGSPALGAGTGASGVATDERGSKLDAPDSDIGAYQSQGFTITVVGGSGQSATIDTAFAKALSVVVTANDPNEPVAGGVITFLVPSSGASVALSSEPVAIGKGGAASVTAKANSTAGSYTIEASTSGDSTPADFGLTNTQAASHPALAPTVQLKKKQKVVTLTAQIDPPSPGGAVPTGTVIFEILQHKKKPKILGTAKLVAGTATLPVASKLVINKLVTIVYDGDGDFLKSTETTKIKAGSSVHA